MMIARLAALVLLGAFIGGQINRAIYRWAWNQRSISPWSLPPSGASARTWRDRLPIVGWWWMRRETPLHGPGFWLRPLIIELTFAIALAALYWWETRGGLLPQVLVPQFPGVVPQVLQGTIHAQFMSHAILFVLMTIATFIDIDEKTIPDQITIPGTLIALLLATYLPMSKLPSRAAAPLVEPLILTSPLPWQPNLDGTTGLWVGLACFMGWCYGLLPKTIWTRSGAWKALRYLLASIARHPWSIWIGGMACVGCVAIWLVWLNYAGDRRWESLLTALVGMGLGGGLVWAVRIVFSWLLKKEAMGFGDVTLMAMIGAFLGWQPAWMIFFMSPFTSLVLAVTQWIITGQRMIAFGPYLCVTTAFIVTAWAPIWQQWHVAFELGWLVPTLVMLVMGIMIAMMLSLQAIGWLLGRIWPRAMS